MTPLQTARGGVAVGGLRRRAAAGRRPVASPATRWAARRSVELLLDATDPGRPARRSRHVVLALELVARASSAAPHR